MTVSSESLARTATVSERADGERFLSQTKLAELERLLSNLEDVDEVGEVLACTVPDLDEPPGT